MKMLICTDGSKASRKAIEEGSKIANGCSVEEITLIHVYKFITNYSSLTNGNMGSISSEDIEKFKEMQEKSKEKTEKEANKILMDGLELLKEKNIKAETVLKEGHTSETITRFAVEKGIDMIVMGSRGRTGLKKLLLGSVSNAVVQEASTNVLIVK